MMLLELRKIIHELGGITEAIKWKFSVFAKYGKDSARKRYVTRRYLSRVGLDRAYISNVENGKQNLTISTMEKIATTLKVSLSTLLT